MGLYGIFILKTLLTALCICRHICLRKNPSRTRNYVLVLLEKEEMYENTLLKKERGLRTAFVRSFTEF